MSFCSVTATECWISSSSTFALREIFGFLPHHHRVVTEANQSRTKTNKKETVKQQQLSLIQQPTLQTQQRRLYDPQQPKELKKTLFLNIFIFAHTEVHLCDLNKGIFHFLYTQISCSMQLLIFCQFLKSTLLQTKIDSILLSTYR